MLRTRSVWEQKVHARHFVYLPSGRIFMVLALDIGSYAR